MTRRLKKAFVDQKQNTEQFNQKISGMMGITLGGSRVVEVANRNSYVYIRLRNSQSEVIQAFNNKVAPSYNLPVLVERQGNRYVVVDVDTKRYDNNWGSYSPYLARHGNTHSLDPETGGGGDVVWVHGRQFMPLLAFPSGSAGSPNLIVAPYLLKNDNGTWKYVGNTGTASFAPYTPPNSGTAVMGLIALDNQSGNPYLIINSGSTFSDTITGSSQIYSYIPALTNPAHIPIAAVRLVSGTSRLSWDNIYDVRQFVHPIQTGSAGISSIAIQDEGTPQGSVTSLNFVGSGVEATVSGSVARIQVTGGSGSSFTGDANSVVLTDSGGALDTQPWLKWGTSTRPFIEFGADVAGKESNAGKMGYGSFGNEYHFYIIGAGTGSNRLVHISDDLDVDDTVQARFFNITDAAATYNILGSPHTHTDEILGLLRKLPRGTMINGKISPTISSGTLNVAVKTLDGTDPSSTNPVYARIGNDSRSITSATSCTLPTGTSLFNLGSAELATKEVDFFAYLIWDSNSAVVAISCSRIPFGNLANDFSSTITNEKHLFNHTNFVGTDEVEVVGRFAATLSASPYVWSVPSYTAINLIQRPIYETRWLDWTADFPTSTAMTVTGETIVITSYKINMNELRYQIRLSAFTIGGTPNAIIINTLPFDAVNDLQATGAMLWVDAGGGGFGGCRINFSSPDHLYWIKDGLANWAAGAGTALNGSGFYEI